MIDIIIPIYKAHKNLYTSLTSLVMQTYKDFKVTLINDCDGLDYSEIIEEYTNKGLNIQYLEAKENKGPGPARQLGVDNTSNEYIYYLDSDDFLMPQGLQILWYLLETNPESKIAIGSILEEENGYNIVISAENNATGIHGKIYRRNFLEEIGVRFPDNQRYNEDGYYNTIAYYAADLVSYYSQEPVMIWKNNSESLTRSLINENGEREFNKLNNPSFVLSQIRALNFLFDRYGYITPSYTIAHLVAIYNETMLYQEYGKEEYLEELKELFNREQIFNWQTDKESLEYLINNLKVGQEYYNSIIMYPYTFLDWIDKTMNEEI